MKKPVRSIEIEPSAADEARIPFVDYSGMALPPGKRQRPSWLRKDGLCFVGCWETYAWRVYSGIATSWLEKDYAFEHSRAFLDDVKKLGCNAVFVPYDCGFGDAASARDVELTAEFAALAHGVGLKVGLYFRPDLCWIETLNDAEREELGDGFARNGRGEAITSFGSNSQMLCYHHPGPLARLRRKIRYAVTDLKADILHFDGMLMGLMEGEGACRCPRCVEDFRRFLIDRYGGNRELARARFGHPCLEQVVPPLESSPYHSLRSRPFDTGAISPHWSEWIAFRCQFTSRILSEVAALVRELNPEVMINLNNGLPAPRENAALFMGTDLIGLGHYTDASWSEDGYPPQILADGKLIQRVRQFKLCRASGTFTLTYMDQENERRLRQNLAHTAAFNEGNIGCIGFPPHMNFSNRYNVHFGLKADFMRWLNAHRDYYRGTRGAARIAVWRPRENLAISGRMTYAATMRMEQLLIETCRGFDFVFDESVEALASYALVIVPNVECMSLDQIAGLCAYVAKGGSLFVGQDSATFDLWHRRRIENPWAALFADASAHDMMGEPVPVSPSGAFNPARAVAHNGKMVRVPYGLGRAVYAPSVVDPAAQPSLLSVHGELNTALDYTNWVPPESGPEFDEAIDWLLQGRDPVRVAAKRGMLVEVLTQDTDKGGRDLIHLVNLCPEPQTECVVDIDSKVPISEIAVLHPPTDAPPRYEVRTGKKGAQVCFDHLDVYAVVVVDKGRSASMG